MEESDAGTYQVKINSTSFHFHNNSEACDAIMLPSLESIAAHAPVTFIVQEQHIPTYDPSSIVSYTHNTLQIHNTINSSILTSLYKYRNDWFRNGHWIPESRFCSTYTTTGDYVGIMWIQFYYLNQHFRDMCYGYYLYFYKAARFFDIPLKVSYYWIEIYNG